MTVLGDRAWWLPGWLDRLLPSVSLEGDLADEAPVVEEVQEERRAVAA